MTTQIAVQGRERAAVTLEDAMVKGDLSGLTPQQRVQHYTAVCESLGLNPLTRPFQYISFQNQLQLYARREAGDQLAALHKVSRRVIGREFAEGLYIVTVRAETPDGRTEDSTGVVPMDGLKGEARANALMKGETKAKRRATLSIVGLGWLDESEVESIRGARYVTVDNAGEITGSAPVALPAPSQVADAQASARAAFRGACGGKSAKAVCQALGIEPNGDAREAIESAARAHGYPLLQRCIGAGITLVVGTRSESEGDITDPDDLPFDDTESRAAAGVAFELDA